MADRLIELWNQYRPKSGRLSNEPALRSGDTTIMDINKMINVESGNAKAKLIPEAAKSYLNMKASLQNQTSIVMKLGDSTFRTLKEQQATCAIKVCDGKSRAKAGASVHGWGRAIDILQIYYACKKTTNEPTEQGRLIKYNSMDTIAKRIFDWMKINGEKFGWINYSRELWHWEYVGQPLGSLSKNSVIGNDIVKKANNSNNSSNNSNNLSNQSNNEQVTQNIENDYKAIERKSNSETDSSLISKNNDIPKTSVKSGNSTSGDENKLKSKAVSEASVPKDKMTLTVYEYGQLYKDEAPKDVESYFSGYLIK